MFVSSRYPKHILCVSVVLIRLKLNCSDQTIPRRYRNKIRMLTKIEDIPVLSNSHVKMRNKEEVLAKINKLIEDGNRKLQIVTDFDQTLTKQRMENGSMVLTSFGMFRDCPSIPQQYKEEDERLCAIYKPIEVDPTLSRETKTAHMVEWYIAANKLLKNIKVPRQELMAMALERVDCFRSGVKEMISWSEQHQVPVLVFSAGLGESVVAALTAADYLLPNVKVVSNFLATDENDTIVGLKGTIIHTYNKNETAIKNTDYYNMVKERCNVLVMGDSIGDSMMAEGMEHCQVTLKVAFLYHNAEGNLDNYLQHFDIVLIDDQTMDIVNTILKLVQ